MGISSRDYIRESRPVQHFGGRSNLWAIKFLIIANVAIFLAQNAIPQVTEWLGLSLAGLQSFQVWQLFTYGFCHSTLGDMPTHIFFNMFVLWMFGRAVEPIYGSREFLAFYLVGIIVAGVCHVLVSPVLVVGASGGVMAVVFLTAMVYPRMTVLLFFAARR